MPVYNVMEEVVQGVLQQYEKELHLNCNCKRCKDDIMAIALNEIKPRYIVNSDLSPYIRATHVADHQGATNILSTVVKAARIVSANPRCENAKKE
ncbi:late competence development ComFB family protein [Sporosarcina sp. UB5]|uniref:late competence development ComFB family protein n=1 Tax=Sporosarcina sp. UB5 TaxID=3047463 RepID=UPI003D79A727